MIRSKGAGFALKYSPKSEKNKGVIEFSPEASPASAA
jgi:hypothetical protein